MGGGLSNTVKRRLRPDCSWRQTEFEQHEPRQQLYQRQFLQQPRRPRQSSFQDFPDAPCSQYSWNRPPAQAPAHDPAVVRQLHAIESLERRLVALEAYMGQHEPKQDVGGACVALGGSSSTIQPKAATPDWVCSSTIQPKVHNLESKVLEMAASLTELRHACMQHAAVLTVVLHRDSSGQLKQYAQDHCNAVLAAGATVQSVFQPSIKMWQEELPLERETSFWYVAKAGNMSGDDTSTSATSSGKSFPARALHTSQHAGSQHTGAASPRAVLESSDEATRQDSASPRETSRAGVPTEAKFTATKEAAPQAARAGTARGPRPTLKQPAAASNESDSGPAAKGGVADSLRTDVHGSGTKAELSGVSPANQHTMGATVATVPLELEPPPAAERTNVASQLISNSGAQVLGTGQGSEAARCATNVEEQDPREEMRMPSHERMPSDELAEGLEGGRVIPLNQLGLATCLTTLSGDGLNRSLTASTYMPTMGICGECSYDVPSEAQQGAQQLPPTRRQVGILETLAWAAGAHQGHGGG